MEWLSGVTMHIPPLARLAIAFFLILVVPMLCRRLSLPAVVGLLVAGTVIGPQGLKIIRSIRIVCKQRTMESELDL